MRIYPDLQSIFFIPNTISTDCGESYNRVYTWLQGPRYVSGTRSGFVIVTKPLSSTRIVIRFDFLFDLTLYSIKSYVLLQADTLQHHRLYWAVIGTCSHIVDSSYYIHAGCYLAKYCVLCV